MKLVTPYRVVVSALLALAVAILYVGFNAAKDPEPSLDQQDQRIVQVQPPAGSTVLRQERIFAELDRAYTGVLLVDGVEIPEDQTDRSEGLHIVAFTPGPGTETGQLDPGPRCATVVFWPASSAREKGTESYKWCWNAH